LQVGRAKLFCLISPLPLICFSEATIIELEEIKPLISVDTVLYSGNEKLMATVELQSRKDAFIVCHGFSSNKDDSEEVAVFNEFVSLGFTALRLSHVTGRKEDLIFQEQALQLVDAVSLLKSKYNIARVHLCGISMGASNAVVAGAMDRRVSSVCSISGISDGEIWMRERHGSDFKRFMQRLSRAETQDILNGGLSPFSVLYVLNPGKKFRKSILKSEREMPEGINFVSARTLRSLLVYRPVDFVPALKDRVCLFIHGKRDGLVSWKHTSRMSGSTESSGNTIYFDSGDHDLVMSTRRRKEIISRYLDAIFTV
jgi:pimeloyl-ACP methyl ester carboxylesterase